MGQLCSAGVRREISISFLPFIASTKKKLFVLEDQLATEKPQIAFKRNK